MAFFDDPPADMLEPEHKTTDGDHGRIEERRHVVCHKLDWLFSDRRYAGEPRFPHLAMIERGPNKFWRLPGKPGGPTKYAAVEFA